MFEEDSPIAFVSFDEQARITQINAAAAKLLGVSRKRFLGMAFPAALHPDEVPKFLDHLHRCRASAKSPITTELKVRRNGDKTVLVELSTAPVITAGQRRFLTAIIDLQRTEQRLQVLLEAKQIAEQLFEFVSYPLVALDRHLTIITTNSAFREKFRLPPEELQNRGFAELELVRWHDETFVPALQRLVRHNVKMREFVLEASLAGAVPRLTLRATAVRMVLHPEASPVILLTFEDITERQRREKERERMVEELREFAAQLDHRVHERTAELAEANARLQALSQQVIDAQENERRFLARELHDEVGQSLTGLNLLLHRPRDEATGRMREEIQDAREIVADLLHRVRQMSIDLRPQVLDDLGLAVALDWHVKTFSERTNIRVALDLRGLAEQKIPAPVELVAFRIVQEALTNVARHAGTDRAQVEAHADGESLSISISDEGRGFDPEAAQKGGIGLTGMRERTTLAGGEFHLESAPGAGTRISIQLPLKRRAD